MYKKSELRLCSNGFIDLAQAVLKRWQKDGKPKSSIDSIKLWKNIIEQYIDENKITYHFNLNNSSNSNKET